MIKPRPLSPSPLRAVGGLLDPSFRWKHSSETDIRDTFARVKANPLLPLKKAAP